MNESFNVLQFRVNQVSICLDIQYINKVLPLTALEQIPDCPPYLAGVLNEAGKSIMVADLGLRLSLPRTAYTIDTPMIICTIDKQTMGMIVDQISGLALLEKNNLQMKEEFQHEKSPFQAVANIENELSLLLKPLFILTLFSHTNAIINGIRTINMEKH